MSPDAEIEIVNGDISVQGAMRPWSYSWSAARPECDQSETGAGSAAFHSVTGVIHTRKKDLDRV